MSRPNSLGRIAVYLVLAVIGTVPWDSLYTEAQKVSKSEAEHVRVAQWISSTDTDLAGLTYSQIRALKRVQAAKKPQMNGKTLQYGGDPADLHRLRREIDAIIDRRELMIWLITEPELPGAAAGRTPQHDTHSTIRSGSRPTQAYI
jgi:hypothetical protein